MRRVWVLHNPSAGRLGNAPQVERAAEALARRGVTVHLEQPPTIEGLRHSARVAAADGAEAVLVAGGDGSLGVVAGELAGTSVAVGVLPVGTANVWAKEMGVPLPGWPWSGTLERAALRQMDGQARPVDLGRCNEHLFLLWAGVGLDAFVMHQLQPHRAATRRFGFLYNFIATFLIAPGWPGADLRIVAGGRELAGHYLLAVVSNIAWYAGGMFRLRPGVRLDDGQMDVWLFEGRTFAETLAHAARLCVGAHVRHPQVTGLTADRVDIYTAAPQVIHHDGEPLPPAQHFVIDVVPRAVRVLIPSGAPPGLFE
jgi:YegS/Rv2252/BmrU family lipid kinase